VSGTVVAIALAMRRPIAVAACWGSRETLAAAEAVGARWPRAGLVLLDISEGCGRLARRMLSLVIDRGPGGRELTDIGCHGGPGVRLRK